ncbi:MAG: winged helix-turn-helix domain-containing protein [Acholeplasmataceae bacterium]|nr:winged helix-turn-helix domain-containing protein [Acholeplasmataceae bacterium]
MKLTKEAIYINVLLLINLVLNESPKDIIKLYEDTLSNVFKLNIDENTKQILKEYEEFYVQFEKRLDKENLSDIFRLKDTFYNLISIYMKVENRENKNILNNIYDEWLLDKDLTLDKSIDALPLSANDKWILFKFISDYDEHISNVFDVVLEQKKFFNDLLPLLKNSYLKIDNFKDMVINNTALNDTAFSLSNDIEEIVPLISAPFATLIQGKKAYRGILIDLIVNDKSEDKIAKNLTILKSVIDNTKFAILSSIAQKPKYGAELAKELNLTPGTITYHTNELTAFKLISPTAVGGKIFYSINNQRINSAFDEIKKLLILQKNDEIKN